jgi:hypothetical protein
LVPSFLQHLFEGTPEDTLPETYGPGEPEEADDEAMDEGVMAITNTIFEEDTDDVDEEQEDVDGTEEEEEQEGADGAEEEEEVDNSEEEEEQAVHGTEVEDAAMVIQTLETHLLLDLVSFYVFFVCILV